MAAAAVRRGNGSGRAWARAVAMRAAARLAPDTEYGAIPRRLDAASVDAVAWDQVDVVVSAVDSLAARAFLSRVCVERGLPFVDCGTLGAAASVQPALPHATESWRAPAAVMSSGCAPVFGIYERAVLTAAAPPNGCALQPHQRTPKRIASTKHRTPRETAKNQAVLFHLLLGQGE